MAAPRLSKHTPAIPGHPPSDKISGQFQGPRGSLQHRCGRCSDKRGNLSRCSGCKIVRYCSREHQVQDWAQHKVICSKIKELRSKLDKEDKAVRTATSDFTTPANAFETGVGDFWDMFSTRDYTQARFALAAEIRRAGTLDGVSEALEHLRDMQRVCRGDNTTPTLTLQMDQDQEYYGFVKWWWTVGSDADSEIDSDDDSEGSHLDLKNADVLEDVQFLASDFPDTAHLGTILLLKFKLLVDVINLKLARKVITPRTPPELWHRIESRVLRSSLSQQWAGKPYRTITAVQQKLEVQIKRIASFLQKANQYFLQMLLEPKRYLGERPGYYSHGTFEEVQLIAEYSYPAWWEHHGVLELLESAREIAKLDSEDEIAGMMASTTFKKNPGAGRSQQELLEDVSRNRLWGYFDDAVADSFYLGAIKPSQTRREQAKEAWRLAEEEEREGLGDGEAMLTTAISAMNLARGGHQELHSMCVCS